MAASVPPRLWPVQTASFSEKPYFFCISAANARASYICGGGPKSIMRASVRIVSLTGSRINSVPRKAKT